jgi:hypothetical protein
MSPDPAKISTDPSLNPRSSKIWGSAQQGGSFRYRNYLFLSYDGLPDFILTLSMKLQKVAKIFFSMETPAIIKNLGLWRISFNQLDSDRTLKNAQDLEENLRPDPKNYAPGVFFLFRPQHKACFLLFFSSLIKYFSITLLLT